MGQVIIVRKEDDLHLMAEAQIFNRPLQTSTGENALDVLSGEAGIEVLEDKGSGVVRTRADLSVGSTDILPAPTAGEIYFGDRSPVKFRILPRDDESIGEAVTSALTISLDPGPQAPRNRLGLKAGKPH